jgi:broad specificity phosphatase PhoE
VRASILTTRLDAPLYVLRHGETAWNTERRVQGTKDSCLTERGRAQAVAMGRALRAELAREEGPVVFLRSPLGRVRETSLLVGAELGLDHDVWCEDRRLAELSYGRWEGSTWTDIERERPNAYLAWKHDPEAFEMPDGETHAQLHRRTAEMLSEIAASGRRTVVIGHGVSGAVMRGLHLGLDARASIALEKPQGVFFFLMAGVERRIEAS